MTETDQPKKTEAKPDRKPDQLAELTATLQRIHADFENYKKRVEKEKEQIAQSTKAKFVQQLLPVMDTFTLALNNNANPEQFARGIKMLYAELAKLLESNGLKPIEAVGKKLDPHMHEVLMQESKDGCDDDTITEELQKGYMLDGMVIRTSKVKIAKKSKPDDNATNAPHHNP